MYFSGVMYIDVAMCLYMYHIFIALQIYNLGYLKTYLVLFSHDVCKKQNKYKNQTFHKCLFISCVLFYTNMMPRKDMNELLVI